VYVYLNKFTFNQVFFSKKLKEIFYFKTNLMHDEQNEKKIIYTYQQETTVIIENCKKKKQNKLLLTLKLKM